jgi:hypothetical protein
MFHPQMHSLGQGPVFISCLSNPGVRLELSKRTERQAPSQHGLSTGRLWPLKAESSQHSPVAATPTSQSVLYASSFCLFGFGPATSSTRSAPSDSSTDVSRAEFQCWSKAHCSAFWQVGSGGGVRSPLTGRRSSCLGGHCLQTAELPSSQCCGCL